jgi:hypothetical protein
LLIKESKTINLTPLQVESDSEEISEDETMNQTPSTPAENKIKISVRLPNGNQIKFNIDPV